jgi:hypothetical protein
LLTNSYAIISAHSSAADHQPWRDFLAIIKFITLLTTSHGVISVYNPTTTIIMVIPSHGVISVYNPTTTIIMVIPTHGVMSVCNSSATIIMVITSHGMSLSAIPLPQSSW